MKTETTEKPQKKVTFYLPDDLIASLKKSAKQHYRSFNGEAIFGLETYLTYWWKDANTPKLPQK